MRSALARLRAARGLALLESEPARPPGLRWAASLKLPQHARLQVDSLLAVMAALEAQLDTVDTELRRFARSDARCLALQTIYGIGPILAPPAGEIGEASRFQRADQITRLAGLDPVVDEKATAAAAANSPKRLTTPSLGTVEAAVHAHDQPTLTSLSTAHAREEQHGRGQT